MILVKFLVFLFLRSIGALLEVFVLTNQSKKLTGQRTDGRAILCFNILTLHFDILMIFWSKTD